MMYSHIMLGADDIEASRKFYDATLGALGYRPGRMDDRGRVFWMDKAGVFSITKPIDGKPASGGNGSTVGFAVSGPEQGDAWHKAGLENGGTSIEDPPGVRESATGSKYLAYLRDPAGNKLCVLHNIS